MPTVTDQEMLYSAASRELIRMIADRVEDLLSSLSLERAKAEGRTLVTGEDVMASFDDHFLRKLTLESRDAG